MWIFALAQAATCDTPLGPEAFAAKLNQDWLIAADESGFRAALLESERSIACLTGPLSPLDAARFHRNRALGSLVAGDREAAQATAAAALRLAPDEAAAWGAEEARFQRLLDAGFAPGPLQEFPTSLAAKVYSDGSPKAERVTGLPVLVQVFSPKGPPVGAAWVDARAAMPEWVTFTKPDCPAPAAVDAVLAHVERAEAAFVDLELEAFEAALQAIAVDLPCLRRPLQPTQAAAIHRLEGLRLYTYGSRLGAVRSFQQAQVLDAAYEPPESLTREGSTLAALWKRGRQGNASPWIATDVPTSVNLRVDGLRTHDRPATLPSIVQVVDPDGEVVWTHYLPPVVALPDLSKWALEGDDQAYAKLTPALRVYRDSQRRSNLRTGVQLGGAVLLAAGGTVFAAHATHAADFNDPLTPPEELLRLRKATNRSASVSAALLGAGAAVIGVSVVIP